MTAIHELSSITPLSELEVFSVPPMQNSIEEFLSYEIRPTSTLSSKAFLEFNFTSGINEYIRLDKTMLKLNILVKIEKPLKVDVTLDDWKKVSPVNNLLHSIFKQVDLTIGDRVITLSHQTYAYKAELETRLGISKEAKESFLTAVLWYPDNNDDIDGIHPIRSSFLTPVAESEKFGSSCELDLMGKISLDMAEQERPLIGGCTTKFKFIPNDPSFYLMAKSDVRVISVDFLDATLKLDLAKVSSALLEGHLHALALANAKYPIRRSFVVASTVNKGTMDTVIDNIHNGQLPRRIHIALVSHAAYNGSYTLNPYNYQHFDLCYLASYLNGIQYPQKAFQPDFSKGLYVREYLSMFDASNQMVTDSCINIDRVAYAKGATIISINYAPDLSSGCSTTGYANPVREGSLRLHLRFKKSLDQTINVLALCEFDNIIEINKERNPVYNFR